MTSQALQTRLTMTSQALQYIDSEASELPGQRVNGHSALETQASERPAQGVDMG